MYIAENIRKFREIRGYTPKELAKLSGTAETTVRQYEREERSPRVEQIVKIANALGVSPLELLGWSYMEKYPKIGTELKESDMFINYLESIGYSVLSRELPKRSSQDKAYYEITLIKDGQSIIFSEDEFLKMMLNIKDVVDVAFYKRIMKNM